jgi:hypothetical protein
MTMMLGLVGVQDGHTRPMTAQVEGDHGPIWFFTAKDNTIVRNLQPGSRAIATFASRNHDLFAAVHGQLSVDNDREAIDRLWNLALLRLDPEHAEIWLNANSLVAGIRILFGRDPKEDYKENVAKVTLR